MMKNRKLLILCALIVAGSLSVTACGNGRNNATEAPYEDETNEKDTGTPSSDLKDAGRNLMDSIKDTGDAIRDGVDNLGDGTNP